jgi:hypothetical protein
MNRVTRHVMEMNMNMCLVWSGLICVERLELQPLFLFYIPSPFPVSECRCRWRGVLWFIKCRLSLSYPIHVLRLMNVIPVYSR